MSNQLFESELLSDQRYNQVCEEKIPERQAVIMATGLREKMRAEEKSFQKFVNVLEKKLDLKPLAKFLQGKLGELCVVACCVAEKSADVKDSLKCFSDIEIV